MKIFRTVFQLCFLFNCGIIVSCNQSSIVIKGDIDGLDTKMVYLYNNYPVRSLPIDSAPVSNNKFQFTFYPDTTFQPNLVFISYRDKKGNRKFLSVNDPYNKRSKFQAFIMEPGFTTLKGTISKGDDINLEAGKQNEFYFKNHDLPFLRISTDSAKRQLKAKSIQKLIHANPDAYWIRFAFENLKFQFTKTQLNLLYNEFSDNIKQSYEGKKLKGFIELLPENENDFLNNKLVDVKNASVSLIDTTKKLNMVVFWASWCGPCRMEIPSIKRIAKKQSDKNFRLVSVTIDDDKKKWLQALNEENMPWQQLFIPSEKKKQAIAQYNLYYVPQIYFINDKHIIIKKIRGFEEENEEKIQTFVGQYLSKN